MDGLIIGVILIVIAWRGFHLAKMFFEENKRQHEIAETRANTPPEKPETVPQQPIIELIVKATDGLSRIDTDGNAAVATRIGALYALEHIAQNNIDYHIKIMEILCAYIRTNSPRTDKTDKTPKGKQIKQPREDIQEALNILGRRGGTSKDNKHLKKEIEQDYHLNLSYCNLQRAFLKNTNLSRAIFNGSNLNYSNFAYAELSYARFSFTVTSNTNFYGANLTGAEFEFTNLSYASLYCADLTRVHFMRTNLTDASFAGANLTAIDIDILARQVMIKTVETKGAYVSTSSYFGYDSFTQKQFNKMFCASDVGIPDELKRPKHWPTERLSHESFMNEYGKWLEKKYPEIDKSLKDITFKKRQREAKKQ